MIIIFNLNLKLQKNYLENDGKIKNHIQKGDFYEANYCYEWIADVENFNAKNIFEKLSNLTQAPYKVYADLKDHYVLKRKSRTFLKKRESTIF